MSSSSMTGEGFDAFLDFDNVLESVRFRFLEEEGESKSEKSKPSRAAIAASKRFAAHSAAAVSVGSLVENG